MLRLGIGGRDDAVPRKHALGLNRVSRLGEKQRSAGEIFRFAVIYCNGLVQKLPGSR
jgi:hypothetical protein